ncbi:MAG: murein biosynthesis integral membrane protein MurJ [Acidobacteriota bacterium]
MSAGKRQSAASVVAVGIFVSRVMGLVRERAVAHFFGVGPLADVLQAAFKGPNLLQNLLGEGTISAAFIPVYSRLVEEGRKEDAGRFAGAIFGLLVCLAGGLALIGVLLARPLVGLLTPGFVGDAARVAAGELTVDRFELAVRAVRWIFPMTGLLVLSAWALGILNSHRRFLLPYLAPVVWNGAIIAALVGAGLQWGGGETRVLIAACVGALVGGALQFGIQLPGVLRLLGGLRPSLSIRAPGVRQALGAFGPVVAGRGVYQLSGYLDVLLASLLAAGALSAMRYAQILYILPISLFGLSVAASELPELARLGETGRQRFLGRVEGSLRQMMFLLLPSVVGYLAFGYLLVGAIFLTGSFQQAANLQVYAVLCAYTLGLPATAVSRLLQNSFFALDDTRTPAKVAVLRVVLSVAVGVPAMFWFDRFAVDGSGGSLFFGAVGLALGSAVGAWTELAVLSYFLGKRMPSLRFPWRAWSRAAGLTLLALVGGAAVSLGLGSLPVELHPIVRALTVLGAFAGLYLVAARAFRFSELETWLGRFGHKRPHR